MTKFVNKGGPVDHYFPAGHSDSLPVDAGQVVDVGEANVEELDDCYLVGEGDSVRAWPKSRWEMQAARSRTRDKSTTSENVAETTAE